MTVHKLVTVILPGHRVRFGGPLYQALADGLHRLSRVRKATLQAVFSLRSESLSCREAVAVWTHQPYRDERSGPARVGFRKWFGEGPTLP